MILAEIAILSSVKDRKEKTMKKLISMLLAIMMITSIFGTVASAASTDIVYVTNYGDKYHQAGCKHLRRSQIPITLEDAVRSGYQACSDCYADRLTLTRTTTAAPAAASITPEQAVQQAFALYVQSGVDQNTALQRVQAKTAEIVSQPANIAAIVAADVNALKAAVPAAAAPVSAALTPQQIVEQAFALYVQGGLDQNTALQRVQAKMGELVAQPANMAAIVQADLAALKGAAPTAALTPEQIVQQAFAQYIAAGMTQDQALAAVQANLPALLAGAQ